MRGWIALSGAFLLALGMAAPAAAEIRLPDCAALQELAVVLPYREVLAPNAMSQRRVPAALFDRRVTEAFGRFALQWSEQDFERVAQHALNCRLAIRATSPDAQRRQQALDDLRQSIIQTSWYMRARNQELQEFRTNVRSFAGASPPDIFRIVLLFHLTSINDSINDIGQWFNSLRSLLSEIVSSNIVGRYNLHLESLHIVRPLSQNIAAADFPDVARLANELLDNHVTRFLRALNEGIQVPSADPRSLRSLRELDAYVDRALPKAGAPEIVQRLRNGIASLIATRENEIISQVESRLNALTASWRTAASLRQPAGVQPSMASVRWPEGLPRPEEASSLSNDAWARLGRIFDERAASMASALAEQTSARISQAADPQAILAIMRTATAPDVPEDFRARFQSEARARLAAVLPQELARIRERVGRLPETEAGLRELDVILDEARNATRGASWAQPWLDGIAPIVAARRDAISRALEQAQAALVQRAQAVVTERIRTAETAWVLMDIAMWDPNTLGPDIANAQRFFQPGHFDPQLRARLPAVMERSVREAREHFASYPVTREALAGIEEELRIIREEWRPMAWLGPFTARVEALAQDRMREIREQIIRAEAGPLSGRVYRSQDLAIEFIDERRAILTRNLFGMVRNEEVIDYELLGSDRIIFRIDGRNIIGRRDMDVIRLQDHVLRRETQESRSGTRGR